MYVKPIVSAGFSLNSMPIWIKTGLFHFFFSSSFLNHIIIISYKPFLNMTGALTGGQMGPGELLQQRLRCGQVREALGILEAMDWSTMGDEMYRGLSSVTNHLLRMELNPEREGGFDWFYISW